MSQANISPLSTLLITGLLAILGTVAGGLIKGYWDTALADKSFQTGLVMKALEADEQEGRINSLRFMIETNLIADPAIRDGLEQYLKNKPNAVPHIRATTVTYPAGVVVPTTAETAGLMDYTVFVCDAAWDSEAGQAAAAAVVDALKQGGSSGQIALRKWQLYDEIPLAALRDKLTVIVDLDHDESRSIASLKQTLAAAGISDIQVVGNNSTITPWRISLVSCPSH